MDRSYCLNDFSLRQWIPIFAVVMATACADDVLRPIEDAPENPPPEAPMMPGDLVVREFGGVRFEFSYIPAGTFLMGAPTSDSYSEMDERPQHWVTLTKPFLMLRNEVTQAQYQAVTGSNPTPYPDDLSKPVVEVPWQYAEEFCAMLNQLEVGANYRLPTEAEWEYAARAGTTTPCYGNVDEIAWTRIDGVGPHPVMTKLPNDWSLYDMLGNVAEWTADWYGDFSSSAATDPTGPATGSLRICRGGNWYYYWPVSRASWRGSEWDDCRCAPGLGGGATGFRPVRSLP